MQHKYTEMHPKVSIIIIDIMIEWISFIIALVKKSL